MNPLLLMPFALIVVPFIPTLIEFFRRKDRGPREIPEQTTYEEKPGIESAPRLERARGEARAKEPGEVIRVMGNITVPDGTEIDNHLVVQGNLKFGKNCHVRGSVKTFGDVEIGEYSVIEGHVLSEGKVHVGRESVVRGIVDSLQDIIVEENALVEAVSTEKTVKLGPGAKINRRIVSGSAIITSAEQPKVSRVEITPQPPVTEEPRPTEVKPPSLEPAPALRSREVSPTKEPDKKVERTTDQIFGYLEDRIRKFDKIRAEPANEISPEGLDPTEVRVLKLSYVCSSLEEMCLRLLMDPPQLQEILNGLVQRGYLDRNLRPTRRASREDLRSAFPERVPEQESRQPTVAEEAKVKHVVAKEKPAIERSTQEEVIERLIASKMREELKKKIRAPPEETTEGKKEAFSGEKASVAGKEESKDVLKEWEKASSLLWGSKGKEEKNDQKTLRSAENTEPKDASAKSTGGQSMGEAQTGGLNKDKENSEPSSISKEPPRFHRFGFKGLFGSVKLGNLTRVSVFDRGAFSLPVLTLVTLLSAEIAYYGPSSTALLDGILPFNSRIWVLLLALAVGFGSASVLYTTKYLRRRDNMTKISERRI